MTTVKVILLDIEGTVCPISFVKDVLFPFALKSLHETLVAQWDQPQFAPYRDAFPAEYREDASALEAHVRELMSQDVKIHYLKGLQGYLWEEGYRSGQLTTPLFTDVLPRMKSWTGDEEDEEEENKIRIMIYSSGSVSAQKLLFAHTNGDPKDVTPLIADYFDTVNAGPKTNAASYATIADKHVAAATRSEWLFLSDNVKEVEAALEAGMQSYVVQREGNPPLPEGVEEKYRVIRSFEELTL